MSENKGADQRRVIRALAHVFAFLKEEKKTGPIMSRLKTVL